MLPVLGEVALWLVRSRETTNFTYDISERNKHHLAAMLELVTGRPVSSIASYINEALGDRDLAEHIRERTGTSRRAAISDLKARFGRRLAWYAAVRAAKPEVVVETGVDKGLGSVLLCAALARNAKEGRAGHYWGTDVNPEAGFLLSPPYSHFGTILYGDSIASLRALDACIGIFINDSDHSPEYEYAEYKCVERKLAEDAIILGDNSHASDSLMRFADETGRRFLFFREEPVGHWYRGGGVGFAFRQPSGWHPAG